MSVFLNALSSRLKPSETFAIKARAAELASKGKAIIDLSIGEPDIDTPEHIKEGARKALKEGKTKYTVAAGILELREAIAKKFREENGLKSEAGTVVVSNGGKQAIHEFFQVVLDPEDEVIIPAPYWVSYPVLVEIAGGKPVIIQTSPLNEYKLKPEDLERALTPKARCIIFNSPSNPCGAGYTEEELKQLGEVILKSKTLVLSDEVYEKLVFEGFKFVSFAKAVPELESRTVTVGAFSKTYSMTGWRVGYATGPREIIHAMATYQSQTTSNINSIAQYAALEALRGPHDFLNPMIASFARRIEMATEIIKQTPGLSLDVKPEGAFFLFIRFEGLRDTILKKGIRGSAGLVNYLLETGGVATVPGEAFGDDLAFRLSVAAPDEVVKRGMENIREAVNLIYG